MRVSKINIFQMETKTMTLVTLPPDVVEKIINGIEQISLALSDKKNENRDTEYLTVKEFCEKAKIGRNKYEDIKEQLKTVRVSPRKILISISELDRWFAGEIK